MLLIQLFVDVILSLLLSDPVYLLNEYIKGLQITNNPDTYLSPVQMIAQYNYSAETHVIQTADGYLLQLDRIPIGRVGKPGGKRQPVLLCHAYLASSVQWLFQGPDESLGFKLADGGFDVWMINFRGNTFSRGHVKYTPKQKQFWNYSVQEWGIYDIPASVDFILQTTGFKQIILLGHSASSSALQIMASSLPRYNDKVKAQVHFAPISAIPHSVSLFRLLLPLVPYAYSFYVEKTPGEFGEHDPLNRFILEVATSIKIPPYNLLSILIFLLFGYDPTQFNQEVFTVFSSQFLDGVSFKTIVHTLQFMRPVPDVFAQFDYGPMENIKQYGTSKPPPYNVSRINVPFRVYCGANDLFADPTDCKALYQKVPKKSGFKLINGFNHISFFLALNLAQRLNNDVVNYMQSITNN